MQKVRLTQGRGDAVGEVESVTGAFLLRVFDGADLGSYTAVCDAGSTPPK